MGTTIRQDMNGRTSNFFPQADTTGDMTALLDLLEGGVELHEDGASGSVTTERVMPAQLEFQKWYCLTKSATGGSAITCAFNIRGIDPAKKDFMTVASTLKANVDKHWEVSGTPDNVIQLRNALE